MIVIGIDPGQKGAFAAMHGDQIILHQMPDNALDIVALLYSYKEQDTCHVFLEKAQSMPGQGVSSVFNYGVGFGTILGILAALKIPHTLVHPKTWCKVMHSGTTADDAKARSLEAARRLYPDVQLVRPRCRNPDLGFVDAILIAGYGKRTLGV